ncbi:hypothetical protein EB22_00314 [Enterococcus faecium]|nr:hypothetical protein EB22_00314 [Enterococcus faecium]
MDHVSRVNKVVDKIVLLSVSFSLSYFYFSYVFYLL